MSHQEITFSGLNKILIDSCSLIDWLCGQLNKRYYWMQYIILLTAKKYLIGRNLNEIYIWFN